MSSPSAPAAPDYTTAAQATSAGNLQALQYQTQANRANVNTPYGTESWSDPNNDNDWTESIDLTPQTQSALNSQMQVQENQSNLANSMQGQVANTMSTPFNAPSMSSYLDGVPAVNSGFSGFNSNGLPQVNTNAPTFNQGTANAGATAAYNAQMGMIAPQEQQQTQSTQNQLSLQGLTPGTEAYDNAMKNVETGQAQQNDQIANQSVLTGDQEANANYASALSGYNAGNEAQSQDYGEALQGYDTGQQALASQNQAQEQDYGQALSNYQTAYGAAQENYMEPLNAMNAVLSGQQVQSPSFPGYSQEGQSGGPDYNTATQNEASWDQGLYNTQAAQDSSETNAGIGLASTAAMAFALY